MIYIYIFIFVKLLISYIIVTCATKFGNLQGDKNIIKFDGDHNSPRPQFYFDSITIFFINVLNPPTDMPDDHYYDMMHNYFDQVAYAIVFLVNTFDVDL